MLSSYKTRKRAAYREISSLPAVHGLSQLLEISEEKRMDSYQISIIHPIILIGRYFIAHKFGGCNAWRIKSCALKKATTSKISKVEKNRLYRYHRKQIWSDFFSAIFIKFDSKFIKFFLRS